MTVNNLKQNLTALENEISKFRTIHFFLDYIRKDLLDNCFSMTPEDLELVIDALDSKVNQLGLEIDVLKILFDSIHKDELFEE